MERNSRSAAPIKASSPDFLACLGHPSQIPTLLKTGQVLTRREPRVALVGRSNVGKSSLVNELMGREVARVSQTPGKTQQIFFFESPQKFKAPVIWVDLPGYGFAKSSKSDRDAWAKIIGAYLEADPGLEAVLLLVDGRRGIGPLDQEALDYIFERTGASGSRAPCQVRVVCTKWDQVKTQSERAKQTQQVFRAVQEWIPNDVSPKAVVHFTSSKTGLGVRELIQQVVTDLTDDRS